MNEPLWRPEPESEPTKGAGLERVHAIWRRRKWLALLVFALPFAAAASVVLSLPGLYRSKATVLVERQQVPEAFVRPTVTSELETRLQTISQEILSRSRLEGMISRFNLYAELRKKLSGEEVVEAMRRDIQLELKSTEVKGRQAPTIAFAVSYRGRDPQTVALVTNTLASSYIEENLKAREQQAMGTAEFLKTQVAETKKRLDEQERVVSEFRRRHLGELPQQMQANLASLDALATQLRLNSDNQIRAAERREALASQLAEAASLGQVLNGAGGPGPTPESPALRLARLKQDLAAAQSRYTDSFPIVGRLKDEIVALERDLASARPEGAPAAIPLSPYALRVREALQVAEAEVKILKLEEQRLRNAIAVYQGRVENTPRREQEFQDISRDYEATREQHQSLSRRYEEAQLAESMEQRQKGERFRILDAAVASPTAATPNRGRLLGLAFALTVGLAAAAVVLAEALDTSFHSAAELRAVAGLPILVSIAPIVTEADAQRRRLRFRLATACVLLSLILLTGTSYVVAHGNEQLVRLLG